MIFEAVDAILMDLSLRSGKFSEDSRSFVFLIGSEDPFEQAVKIIYSVLFIK